ncbi:MULTISPECIES: DUF930 domain-containing protein [unclassified Devosia]|uniref:DUF930 domain-containing protein n=1 Tax=unclassified Devosia TaxID=196773 RepID=UPI001AC3E53B|nr:MULTISPECIES: DUF930 domain-containing protein [unclassified Devosia]MBN9305126.1 DUF930 domain-containing protein [Devosia sp.]
MTDLAAEARLLLLPDRRLAAGTLASLLAHGALLAALLLLTPLKQMVVPPPRPVSVEIVTDAELAALEQPAQTPELTAPTGAGAAAPPSTAAPAQKNPGAPPSTILGVHIATDFYAGGILAEPGMAKMKRTLESFAPSERLVQLCNIEGLEQIRRGAPDYDPDTLVTYAMSDPLVAGLTLTAPGAAFRSRRKWYGVAVRCTVAADLESVTGFEFRLGKPIPQSEWEAHNLNAEDSDE